MVRNGADADDSSLNPIKYRERIPPYRKEPATLRSCRTDAWKLGDQASLRLEGFEEILCRGCAELVLAKRCRVDQFGLSFRSKNVGHFRDARMRATASGPFTHCA